MTGERFDACAALVEKGDADRFLATMAAPPAARRFLFPLYAFNLEVARAPQASSEPLIAEMRLQWWRDVLDDIAGGRVRRGHDVTEALAEVLTPDLARALDDLVEARRADLDPEPFGDTGALLDYLDRTAGTLLWVGARMLGAETGDEGAVRALGRAQGLANWFLALPVLSARGRAALPESSRQTIARLARDVRQGARVPLPRNPALLAAWRADALLRQAERHPDRVLAGELGQSEFARKASLFTRILFG